MERLRQLLQRIDGQGYKAYKHLGGSYDFNLFRLSVDHVQGDPFALPSRISVQLNGAQHGLPAAFGNTPERQRALEDFLGRALDGAIRQHCRGCRGSGRSGLIAIAVNGQQVLKRNAVLATENGLEARLLFALPGSGRCVAARDAQAMFFDELPRIVAQGLNWNGRSLKALQTHIESVEDQQALRDRLPRLNAVAFIADGSRLPRRSGDDDRPLHNAVAFRSPAELRQTLTVPNRGAVSGIAIPRGVTLIVGGGFHGKSTLLQALEKGVYDHLPGDGREQVVCDPSAVKIRAEDHRSITGVDISPFITTLPGNRRTIDFSTSNASGSTSQAANIIEALECGCRCLLIDEDTSATNFMIRDRRMRQLVADRQEPITPLLHRVRELYRQYGVSSVIVCGGSGDYLSVADRVIMLDNYRVRDVTGRAARLAGEPPQAVRENPPFRPEKIRRIDFSLAPLPRQKQAKIVVRAGRQLDYGNRRIDLSAVEQLLDAGQMEAIGRILAWCRQHDPEQPRGLIAALQQALRQVDEQGLDLLLPWKAGHLAVPRLYETAAAANRLRRQRKTDT